MVRQPLLRLPLQIRRYTEIATSLVAYKLLEQKNDGMNRGLGVN